MELSVHDVEWPVFTLACENHSAQLQLSITILVLNDHN